MSGNDYTRWNRSGLSRLQYVDGNAATYLEELREKLYRLCGEDAKWLKPSFDESQLGSESTDEEWLRHTINTLLAKQYDERRSGDIGWALMRIFARSCHVLAGHLNAHANETFLRTATEWEDIRKMVSLLGYQPAGATSATTRLVITARAKGTVKKGLQVRHRPITGEKAIVFETLEDIEVDPEFNELEIKGAKANPSTLADLEASAGSPWRASPKAPVYVDDAALVIEGGAGAGVAAARIAEVGREQVICLDAQGQEGTPWGIWQAGTATLKTSPRFKRAPWINGATVRRGTSPHRFSKGSIIAWRRVMSDSTSDAWRFAKVARADTYGLELEAHSQEFIEKANPKYDGDDNWLTWDRWRGDIEVRASVKLTGSFVVPTAADAEKIVGTLADFDSSGLMSKDQPPWAEKVVGGIQSLDPKMTIDTNSDEALSFLQWLFGSLNLFSFPVTPDVIVKLGSMLLTKDARIPSTGQLVLEAFLDIFGGAGRDEKGWQFPPGQQPKVPVLFRFWVDGNATTDSGERLPFGKAMGELWYLPQITAGGERIDPALTEPVILHNRPDGNRFFFDGRPSGIQVGDWVAAKFRDPTSAAEVWHALKIEEIEEPPAEYAQRHAPAFALRVTLPASKEGESDLGEMTAFHADFRHQGPPKGAEVNAEPVSSLDVSPPLQPRQTLLAWNGEMAQLVTALTVDGKTRLEPALSKPFTVGNLKLFGNVVQAGHGERQPPERMGAGTGQDRPDYLILEQREVSTIPDSVIARGAREDIVVRIQGEEWHARTQLDESGPTDRHYVMSTTEMGFLKLQFGEGHHGRALPPGTNNVTIEYRSGAGVRGCVAAGSLDRLVHPHPLIESVRQPLAATGGSDMERREDMRERASASVLAMERAVSVSDFEQLAMQHRSVAKARAFYSIGGGPGRTDLVEVVAVLAGGAQIDGTTTDSLARYLQHRAIPTVCVRVSPHEDCKVTVRIAIRVDPSRYVPDNVRNDVIAAVATAFSIDCRQIGEPLHLSELYAVVEAVTGVEDCECSFSKASGATQVPSGARQICYINAAAIDCPPPTEYEP